MTSIAIKDGEAAADTQLTSETCAFRVQKLIRLPDGGVATGAGAWSRAYAYIQWIIDGESGDPPDLRGAEVWVVRPDKSIWVGECGPLYPILDRMVAIGSGRDIARAALADGATALEAVQKACEHDLASSAPFQTMSVVSVQQELPGAVTYVEKKKTKRA